MTADTTAYWAVPDSSNVEICPNRENFNLCYDPSPAGVSKNLSSDHVDESHVATGTSYVFIHNQTGDSVERASDSDPVHPGGDISFAEPAKQFTADNSIYINEDTAMCAKSEVLMGYLISESQKGYANIVVKKQDNSGTCVDDREIPESQCNIPDVFATKVLPAAEDSSETPALDIRSGQRDIDPHKLISVEVIRGSVNDDGSATVSSNHMKLKNGGIGCSESESLVIDVSTSAVLIHTPEDPTLDNEDFAVGSVDYKTLEVHHVNELIQDRALVTHADTESKNAATDCTNLVENLIPDGVYGEIMNDESATCSTDRKDAEHDYNCFLMETGTTHSEAQDSLASIEESDAKSVRNGELEGSPSDNTAQSITFSSNEHEQLGMYLRNGPSVADDDLSAFPANNDSSDDFGKSSYTEKPESSVNLVDSPESKDEASIDYVTNMGSFLGQGTSRIAQESEQMTKIKPMDILQSESSMVTGSEMVNGSMDSEAYVFSVMDEVTMDSAAVNGSSEDHVLVSNSLQPNILGSDSILSGQLILGTAASAELQNKAVDSHSDGLNVVTCDDKDMNNATSNCVMLPLKIVAGGDHAEIIDGTSSDFSKDMDVQTGRDTSFIEAEKSVHEASNINSDAKESFTRSFVKHADPVENVHDKSVHCICSLFCENMRPAAHVNESRDENKSGFYIHYANDSTSDGVDGDGDKAFGSNFPDCPVTDKTHTSSEDGSANVSGQASREITMNSKEGLQILLADKLKPEVNATGALSGFPGSSFDQSSDSSLLESENPGHSLMVEKLKSEVDNICCSDAVDDNLVVEQSGRVPLASDDSSKYFPVLHAHFSHRESDLAGNISGGADSIVVVHDVKLDFDGSAVSNVENEDQSLHKGDCRRLVDDEREGHGEAPLDGTRVPSQEDASSDIDRQPGDIDILMRLPKYIMRVPRFVSDEFWAKINAAQLEVERRTQERDSVRVTLQIKKANCGTCWDHVLAARLKEREAREAVDVKYQELNSAQIIINRMKDATSIDDIDEKIHGIEQMIEHETMNLKEEKKLIREIQQLKQTREQFRANIGTQAEVEEAFQQRDSIKEQFKVLKQELDNCRSELWRAEGASKAAKKKHSVEYEELINLENQFNRADTLRQEAYAKLQSLKKQMYERSKYYHMYRADQRSAAELASSGDREALRRFCSSQVERFMKLWNKNDEFRNEYVKHSMMNTSRRFRAVDGRSLGPGEELPVVCNSVEEKPETRLGIIMNTSAAPTSASSTILLTTIKDETRPNVERDGRESSVKSRKPDMPTAVGRGHGAGSPEMNREEEKTLKQGEEDEMKTAGEEVRRKEEAAAKLKQQRRLEEMAKAKEAQERKRRHAEKAKARAELRAKKEAELKQKAREKRARKKEMKSGMQTEALGESAEDEPYQIPSDMRPADSVKQTGAIEKCVTMAKRYFKLTPASEMKPITRFPIRNRSRMSVHRWVWWTVSAALILMMAVVAVNIALASKSRRSDHRI